jgi:hypothetical protein
MFILAKAFFFDLDYRIMSLCFDGLTLFFRK